MTADDREAEVLELLDAAIARLDPREREVLALRAEPAVTDAELVRRFGGGQ